MPMIQELGADEVREVLRAAVERQLPLTVTVRREKSWTNLRSRVLAVADRHLLIERPVLEDGKGSVELLSAERVSASFKHKHYKHLFFTIVAGETKIASPAGGEIPAVSLCEPLRVSRLQRRAFTRAAVPENRIVRASFWLGGKENEPVAPYADRPVWTGRVVNLSAGGFLLRVRRNVAEAVEAGDMVGLHMTFGPGEASLTADAHLRRVEVQGELAEMGFQLIGLAETPEGLEVLGLIGVKVGQYHRMQEATGSRR